MFFDAVSFLNFFEFSTSVCAVWSVYTYKSIEQGTWHERWALTKTLLILHSSPVAICCHLKDLRGKVEMVFQAALEEPNSFLKRESAWVMFRTSDGWKKWKNHTVNRTFPLFQKAWFSDLSQLATHFVQWFVKFVCAAPVLRLDVSCAEHWMYRARSEDVVGGRSWVVRKD